MRKSADSRSLSALLLLGLIVLNHGCSQGTSPGRSVQKPLVTDSQSLPMYELASVNSADTKIDVTETPVVTDSATESIVVPQAQNAVVPVFEVSQVVSVTPEPSDALQPSNQADGVGEMIEITEVAVTPEPAVTVDQQASETFGKFNSMIQERLQVLEEDKRQNNHGKFAKNFATLQSLVDELQSLSQTAPESASAHEMAGESAYQFSAYKAATAKRKDEARIEKSNRGMTVKKLKEIAVQSFERSIEIDTDRALPHDRVAKLRLEKKRVLDDPIVLQHFLLSIRNDAENSMSIAPLMKILIGTDILSSSDRNAEIHSVLKTIRGKAREELHICCEDVREQLAKRRVEQIRLASSTVTRSRTVETLDFHIERLKMTRLQFQTPRRRGFGGFLGELNRQAEDSGNFAARMAIDEDIAKLEQQREMILASETLNARSSSEKSQIDVKRLEHVEVLLTNLFTDQL